MQVVVGWFAWLLASTGLMNGTLWQITLTSPQNGAVISQMPNDQISIIGGFYRPNNGKPPIRGSVNCNGAAGIIDLTARTWTVSGLHLNPGANAITCEYKENNDVSLAQIQVTYHGGETLPPVAGFQYSPTSGPSPLLVSFDASESYDPDGGNVISYEWTFGDGASLVTYSPVVAHAYLSVGTFEAQLQVRDDEGILSDPISYSIETYQQNLPPIAQIAASPSSGFAPLTVQFDGSQSTDEDGSISRYEWIFPGSVVVQGSTAQYVFNEAGSYNVTLTVWDNKNVPDSETFAVQVNVDDAGPLLSILPTSGASVITTTPSFVVSYSDAESSVDISTAQVWVDGVDLSSRLSASNSEAILAFSSAFPLSNGDHTITFELKDSHGNLSQLEASYNIDDGTTPIQSVIAGLVTLPDGVPLENVIVSILNGPIGEVGGSSVTDSSGKFSLPFSTGGNYLLSYTLDGYTTSIKNVTTLAGADASTDSVFLKPLDAQVTPIVASNGGVASNSTGTVSMSFPAGALGADATIVLTEAKSGKDLPFPLPELSEFTFAVDHIPANISFNEPVTVEVNNDIGLPANSEIPLGITDSALGQWVDSGRVARVSNDGAKIVYLLDNFSAFDEKSFINKKLARASASDANTSTISKDGSQTTNPVPGGPENSDCNPAVQCCPTMSGSIIKGTSCSLGTSISVPTIFRNGKAYDIVFRYNSETVKPLIAMSTINNQDHLALSTALEVTSNLKVGGITSIRAYEGNSNIKPSVMKDIISALRPNGELMKTGSYPVEHELSAAYDGEYATSPYFGGPAISTLGVSARQPTLLKEKLETRVNIQDQTLSPFGAGWMIEGFERLHEGSDGAILWENGKGLAQTFLPLGSVGTKKTEKIKGDVSDILVHEGFMWVSSCSGNEVRQMTLEGHLHKTWSIICPTRFAPTKRGGVLVVVEGGEKILRLNKNGEIIHAYTKKFGEAPIRAIVEDGALAVHFLAGTDVKTVSPRDGSIFHYAGSQGLIKTEFQSPTDILVDSYDNLVIVDNGSNKIYKLYPKTREVRVILGSKVQVAKLKTPFMPYRLVRDQKLKRFFILENSGQMWHWQGPGHSRIDAISFESGQMKSGITKNKNSISVLAYSMEVGPIVAQGSSIWWNRINEKKAVDLIYQSPVLHFATLTKKTDGTFERVDVEKNKIIFNAAGLITAQIMADGQTTSYVYSEDKLVQILTPAGDGFTLSYSGGGYLESITDAQGRTTEFAINSAGDLEQIVLPDNTNKSFTYSADHLLTSESDEESRATQYIYKQGRIIKEIYPGNRERPISPAIFAGFDPSKNAVMPRITLESQVSEFTTPEGRSTKMEVDEFGQVHRLYAADGSFKMYSRNAIGMPELEISNEGRKLIRKFDSLGREISRVGHNGYTTTVYDSTSGKVSRIYEAYGSSMQLTYNSLAQPISITDIRGNVTTFSYHPNGTLASSTNAKNETTIFEVDTAGNVSAVEDNLGNRTVYIRDDAGNILESTDPKGQKTTMTRDNKGRVQTVTTPLNGTTSFSYTPSGKLESLTDARGKTTSWTYNEQDLVATETNPLGFVEHYFYDGDGLMIQKTLRSGENIFYEFDINKRLKKVTSPNDVIHWSYDKDGLPLSAADNDSSISWAYDGLGRVIKEIQSNAPAPLKFYYDQYKGLLLRRTLGAQISEALGYNEDGAILSMTYKHYGVSGSVKMGRDELGRNISTEFSLGGSVLRTFDGAGRLTALDTKDRSQATVGNFLFGYDPNSNITAIDQMVDGLTTPKNYVYDSENRLTEAQHGATIETWNLDLLGNWTANGKVYNNANQMTEDQNYFYSYDLRGNLTQKSAKIGPEVTNFFWDYFDKLVQVETPSKRVSFKYDATGRRTERLFEDLTNATTKTSRWTYLQDDQWTEMDELGQVLAVTLNGVSIDEVLSMTVKDSNQSSPGIALGPIKDHLGSVYGWANSRTGALIQKQSYTAYGETTISDPSPLLSQLGAVRGYTSREYDEALKLYYYRARYYNPETGRFLTEDPIGFDGGDSNIYRYVLSNSIKFTDPQGQNAIDDAVCAIMKKTNPNVECGSAAESIGDAGCRMFPEWCTPKGEPEPTPTPPATPPATPPEKNECAEL